MKDLDMADINPDGIEITPQQLVRFKNKTDKAIALCRELADVAEAYGVKYCRLGDAQGGGEPGGAFYDVRDILGEMSGIADEASGLMKRFRALGGKIEGGGIARSGGT